jgi:hypothetical protein
MSRHARRRYHDALVQREIRRLAATSERHRRAVLDAEARRLAHILTSYGVLTTERLFELSGAERWRSGRFAGALAHAADAGLIRDLGLGFYAPSALRSPAEHGDEP